MHRTSGLNDQICSHSRKIFFLTFNAFHRVWSFSKILKDKLAAAFKRSTFSSHQVHERATYVGAGLVAIGCEPSQKSFIGIYGPNRVEVSYSICLDSSRMLKHVFTHLWALLGVTSHALFCAVLSQALFRWLDAVHRRLALRYPLLMSLFLAFSSVDFDWSWLPDVFNDFCSCLWHTRHWRMHLHNKPR